MNSIYKNYKFIFDYLIVAILLPFFLPILSIFIILNYLILGTPIFFIDKRIGLNNKIFKMYKLRTMSLTKNNKINTIIDKNRTNFYGKFIRRLSLDEIPQFLNIIKGDMSLIGPRPLPVEYLDKFSINQNKRHLVKPGITGLAQINGRNNISWEKKFNYDLRYVNEMSFSLDFKIILRTLIVLLKVENVNYSNDKINNRFDGE